MAFVLLFRLLNTVRELLRHLRTIVNFGWTKFVPLLKDAANGWMDDKAPRLGASLAFYTLLSLAPLLIVAIAVAAAFFGRKAVEGELFWQIQGLVGREGATAIQGLLRSANKPAAGIISAALGIITLLFGASSVVVELSDALNTIWQAPSPQGVGGLRNLILFVKQRAYAFGLIFGVGFLLLVSLILNAAIAALGEFFESVLPVPEYVLQVVTFLLSFVVITFLFAAIYKLLPSVSLKWSDVLVGASVTSLLFTIGKQLIGLYIGKESFDSTYGAAGSLVVVLVWVYYSSQVFFLGAEFTKVYTRRFGSQS